MLVLAFSVGGCLNWSVEEPESDGDADVDGDADQDVVPDGDADSDLDADIDTDDEGSSDGDADADVDVDVDSDIDADVDQDEDVAFDSDVDADTDVETCNGVEDVCPCPGHDEMIQISPSLCIDRYEASDPGDGRAAASVPDAEPWANVILTEARNGCIRAGKRLCFLHEWRLACEGPEVRVFPYGDTYDPHACNGLDHGLERILLTGSMPTCEGGFRGLFDVAGNVYEWTEDSYLQGGVFHADEPLMWCDEATRIDGGRRERGQGFRCCLDI